MTLDPIQELHTRSVLVCARVVAMATVDDLARPTPCAGWTLADLLAHMTVQDRGFAAAARGAVTTVADWHPVDLGAHAVARYLEAADEVRAAFEEPGVLDRGVVLPEFTARGPIPGHSAIRAHLIDNVVHGWDVARTLDVGYEIDDDMLAESLHIAMSIPDGDNRGTFFAHAVEAGQDATALDRILAYLGRSPAWRRDEDQVPR